MRVTTNGLIRATGVAAILAGLLFVIIQPLHPDDVLASVTTDAWAIIHYATLVMLALFVIGITGIYARQIERIGWIGLAGYIVLVVGLVLTAIGTAIEALVQPLVAASDPGFVEGMLAMVHGDPIQVDLGAIPLLWNAASAGFLGGTLLFGFATFRAGILSRWASAVFAVGLFATAPLAGLLGTPRVGAVPIGIGLAWLGWSLWADRRRSPVRSITETGSAHPDPAAA
ncbi:MAG TPA: hypothetical protein VLA76_02035 [Candidatus Angelobacter sp.]|nr:hypothetical protein [Candidatus Angelobacter sp.]